MQITGRLSFLMQKSARCNFSTNIMASLAVCALYLLAHFTRPPSCHLFPLLFSGTNRTSLFLSRKWSCFELELSMRRNFFHFCIPTLEDVTSLNFGVSESTPRDFLSVTFFVTVFPNGPLSSKLPFISKFCYHFCPSKR